MTADGLSLNNRVSGMLLPIKNQRNYYIGWQHRPHNISDQGAKYHWAKTKVPNRNYDITSHLKETLELPLAYCQPNSGSIRAKAIGLTEGIGFKVQLAANRQQQIVIGASGGQFTASAKSFVEYLASASKQLDNTKDIIFYADAGAVKNPSVLRAYSRTTSLLEREGYQTKFAWWNQVDKSIGDIDEISDLDRKNLSLITLSEFYALGKQYSDWHPKDDLSLTTTVNNLNLQDAKIAEKFAEKLAKSENRESLQETIADFKNRFGDRFVNLKHLAWQRLDPETQCKITANLSIDIQQQRIAKVAPIVADYLKLNQKYRVENTNTLVEYNREEKILTYLNKNDKNEFFTARLSTDGSWQNLKSNISQAKESLFLTEVKDKITQLRSQKSLYNESKRSQLSR